MNKKGRYLCIYYNLDIVTSTLQEIKLFVNNTSTDEPLNITACYIIEHGYILMVYVHPCIPIYIYRCPYVSLYAYLILS